MHNFIFRFRRKTAQYYFPIDNLDYWRDFEIGPEKSLDIKVVYDIIKNPTDTVVWGSFYPTLRLDFTVVMHPSDKQFRAHALYHRKFKKQTGTGSGEGLHTWTL